MRGRISSALLIALLFSMLAMQNISTPAYKAQAQQIPNMYIHPVDIKNSSAVIGQNFRFSINISNVEALFGWQANITFNKAVVNCSFLLNTPTKVRSSWFDNQFGGAGYTQYAVAVNNEAGYILVSGSQKPPYVGLGASGSGPLAYIIFTVKANERATLLAFGENTYLRTAVAGILSPIEPFTAQDGSFDNRPSLVNGTPTADFGYTPLGTGLEGEEIEFDPSLSSDDAWFERYSWDFGDGTTELYMYNRTAFISEETLHRGNWTVKVIHAYVHAGIYSVTLTVTDNDGATATITKDVMVPGHDIAITDVIAPYIAVMPGITLPISVNVSNNGNYTETFDVNAYFNETLVETKNIIDMPAYSETILMFTWNTTEVALGKYVLKANTSEVSGEPYTSNNVYIDGMITVASSNLVQFTLFTGGRAFIVQVDSTSIAEDLNFNSAEKKINFTLTGALGWFSNVTIPMTLLNVSSPDAWIVKLDGNSNTYTATSNGTHYFIYFDYAQSTEPYTVDIIGETAATPPIALFTPSKTTAIAAEPITFDASPSYDTDGTIENWTWDFGDGKTDAGEVVQHSFSANGTYVVTLTVEDNETLTDSTQVTITVIDYPIADFSYSPTEPLVDQTITFDAAISNPVGGTITEYAWKFGDGQTGTGKVATHSYSTTGTFTVNLTITDSEGLANSITKTITVTIHNIALTSLTATPSTVRKGDTVTIQLRADNNGNFTESFTITVYYHDTATDVAIETRSIMDLAGGNSQLLTIVWNTSNIAPNTYTIKAETSIIPEETRTEDNTLTNVTVIVQKRISSLTADVSSATITLGSSTTISGTLTPTLQGKTVTLNYRPVGQSWITLFILTTDAQGSYEFTWTPTLAGTYEIQATWQGDANTEGCQSEIQTITIEEAQGIPTEYIVITIALAIILVAVVIYLLKFRKQ